MSAPNLNPGNAETNQKHPPKRLTLPHLVLVPLPRYLPLCSCTVPMHILLLLLDDDDDDYYYYYLLH